MNKPDVLDAISTLDKESRHDLLYGGPLAWRKLSGTAALGDHVIDHSSGKVCEVTPRYMPESYTLVASDRSLRIKRAELLAEYTFDLDRLADVLLLEELTDRTPWKTRSTEYPFMSETLLGKKTSLDSEYVPENEGSGVGKRRVRSRYENMLADRNAKSANKERNRRYKAFIDGKIDGWLTVRI